jgi:hypothetical protein
MINNPIPCFYLFIFIQSVFILNPSLNKAKLYEKCRSLQNNTTFLKAFQQWLNSVNSESLKNPWNPKSIKTDYLQS